MLNLSVEIINFFLPSDVETKWWSQLLDTEANADVWLFVHIVVSRPAHTAVAFAMAYNPQSEPPCCRDTFIEFNLNFFVGECIRMAICLFTLGSVVQAIQNIHLTLFGASSTYAKPVVTSMEHLDNFVVSGAKEEFWDKSMLWKPPTWRYCSFSTLWLALISLSHSNALRSLKVSWRSGSHNCLVTCSGCSNSPSLYNNKIVYTWQMNCATLGTLIQRQ